MPPGQLHHHHHRGCSIIALFGIPIPLLWRARVASEERRKAISINRDFVARLTKSTKATARARYNDELDPPARPSLQLLQIARGNAFPLPALSNLLARCDRDATRTACVFTRERMRGSSTGGYTHARIYIHIYTQSNTRVYIRPEAVYATEISCTSLLHERLFVQHASAPRARVCTRIYVAVLLARARVPLVRRPRPIHGRPWMMHRLSYVSIGISPLFLSPPRALPRGPPRLSFALARALCSRLPLPPSIPFSLPPSPSSAL